MEQETNTDLNTAIPYALESRAELITSRFVGTAVRRGENDLIECAGKFTDYVAGGENTQVDGTFYEQFSTATVKATDVDTLVDGKLTHICLTDNLILGGIYTHTYIGAVLITSGMSDAMMGGGAIRTTVPSDIWLAGLIGLEEKIGTAIADGALIELSITHFEREFLSAIYAIGACTRTGILYSTLKTSALGLLKVSTHIRTLVPGSGAAAPPPPEAPPPNIPTGAAAGGADVAADATAAGVPSGGGVPSNVLTGATTADDAVVVEDLADLARAALNFEDGAVDGSNASALSGQLAQLDDIAQLDELAQVDELAQLDEAGALDEILSFDGGYTDPDIGIDGGADATGFDDFDGGYTDPIDIDDGGGSSSSGSSSDGASGDNLGGRPDLNEPEIPPEEQGTPLILDDIEPPEQFENQLSREKAALLDAVQSDYDTLGEIDNNWGWSNPLKKDGSESPGGRVVDWTKRAHQTAIDAIKNGEDPIQALRDLANAGRQRDIVGFAQLTSDQIATFTSIVQSVGDTLASHASAAGIPLDPSSLASLNDLVDIVDLEDVAQVVDIAKVDVVADGVEEGADGSRLDFSPIEVPDDAQVPIPLPSGTASADQVVALEDGVQVGTTGDEYATVNKGIDLAETTDYADNADEIADAAKIVADPDAPEVPRPGWRRDQYGDLFFLPDEHSLDLETSQLDLSDLSTIDEGGYSSADDIAPAVVNDPYSSIDDLNAIDDGAYSDADLFQAPDQGDGYSSPYGSVEGDQAVQPPPPREAPPSTATSESVQQSDFTSRYDALVAQEREYRGIRRGDTIKFQANFAVQRGRVEIDKLANSVLLAVGTADELEDIAGAGRLSATQARANLIKLLEAAEAAGDQARIKTLVAAISEFDTAALQIMQSALAEGAELAATSIPKLADSIDGKKAADILGNQMKALQDTINLAMDRGVSVADLTDSFAQLEALAFAKRTLEDGLDPIAALTEEIAALTNTGGLKSQPGVSEKVTQYTDIKEAIEQFLKSPDVQVVSGLDDVPLPPGISNPQLDSVDGPAVVVPDDFPAPKLEDGAARWSGPELDAGGLGLDDLDEDGYSSALDINARGGGDNVDIDVALPEVADDVDVQNIDINPSLSDDDTGDGLRHIIDTPNPDADLQEATRPISPQAVDNDFRDAYDNFKQTESVYKSQPYEDGSFPGWRAQEAAQNARVQVDGLAHDLVTRFSSADELQDITNRFGDLSNLDAVESRKLLLRAIDQAEESGDYAKALAIREALSGFDSQAKIILDNGLSEARRLSDIQAPLSDSIRDSTLKNTIDSFSNTVESNYRLAVSRGADAEDLRDISAQFDALAMASEAIEDGVDPIDRLNGYIWWLKQTSDADDLGALTEIQEFENIRDGLNALIDPPPLSSTPTRPLPRPLTRVIGDVTPTPPLPQPLTTVAGDGTEVSKLIKPKRPPVRAIKLSARVGRRAHTTTTLSDVGEETTNRYTESVTMQSLRKTSPGTPNVVDSLVDSGAGGPSLLTSQLSTVEAGDLFNNRFQEILGDSIDVNATSYEYNAMAMVVDDITNADPQAADRFITSVIEAQQNLYNLRVDGIDGALPFRNEDAGIVHLTMVNRFTGAYDLFSIFDQTRYRFTIDSILKLRASFYTTVSEMIMANSYQLHPFWSKVGGRL